MSMGSTKKQCRPAPVKWSPRKPHIWATNIPSLNICSHNVVVRAPDTFLHLDLHIGWEIFFCQELTCPCQLPFR